MAAVVDPAEACKARGHVLLHCRNKRDALGGIPNHLDELNAAVPETDLVNPDKGHF